MSIAPDNPAKGPEIPPELLNEYLYGVHIRLDDGEEESFVDPNAPPDNMTPGPDIPPEKLNEWLYGVHMLLEGGEEECLIDPNAFTPEPEGTLGPNGFPRSEHDPTDNNGH